MLKNYFKIAIRNLLRNKGFSILNISGLAIGMASAMLILLWVQAAMSTDRFHTKLDRLYQVWSNDKINGTIRSLSATPEIMAPTLKKDYPEIEGVTRVQWTRNLLSDGNDVKLMSVGNVVDSDFLTMFSFPLLRGDAATALDDPQAIVITQKLAKKLFNSDDVVGRTITMGQTDIFKVTGVFRDLPVNSKFRYIEYLCSYAQQRMIDQDWTDIGVDTYVLLKPNTRVEALNNKISDIIPSHSKGYAKTQEFLYPVSRLALYAQFENGKEVGGFIRTVRTFSIIAAFILLIACINFMNLSTARSEKRAKEVGIRKVSGAQQRSLLAQFIGESVLIATIAGILSILILELSLPAFNELTQGALRLDFSNPMFWLWIIAFIVFTGVLAGSYPAFVLSSFRPVSVLKGQVNTMLGAVTLRKVLVVFQFSIAIILIISTIVIVRQTNYARERQVGYNKDRLVHIFIYDSVLRKNFNLIKAELVSSGAASGVSLAMSPLTDTWSSGISLSWEGKDPTRKIQINRCAETGGLVETAGMQLVQGRDIDLENYLSDSTACLINESALAIMKFKNPIGQIIYDDPVKWHVVGVIKDYIQESPYQSIKPLIIKGAANMTGVLLVRLNGLHPLAQDITGMQKILKQYNPAYPPEFTFTDEEYARKFAAEQFTAKLAALFACLVIIISCLGLFGLAAYMAQARVKEIGIRKVLGASAANITVLLSRDFVKLVALAVLIATPLAWYAMSTWLSAYEYRVPIGWSIFVLSGGMAVLIAILTVSYQSIRAALTNPVKNLRAE